MRNRDKSAVQTRLVSHTGRTLDLDRGLTKRETAAIANMAAIRSRCPSVHVSPREAAQHAVADADALFDELDKDKKA